MTRNSLVLAKALNVEGISPVFSAAMQPRGAFSVQIRGAALVTVSLLSVALVALLDVGTLSRLSFSLFYLVPVDDLRLVGRFRSRRLVVPSQHRRLARRR